MSSNNNSPKRFQNSVNKVNKEIQVVNSIGKEQQMKQDFIERYGVNIEMSSTYTFSALFHRQDSKYFISITRSIFPENVKFFDYEKIGTEQEEEDKDFKSEQVDQNKCLLIKIFELQGGKFTLKNTRKCDSSYQNKICISEDSKRIAIVKKSSEVSMLTSALFKKDQERYIDIFDCSSIDFFLKDTPLNAADPCLIATVNHPKLHSQNKMEETFMRFSQQTKYLYLIYNRVSILAYDLQNVENKSIKLASIDKSLPSNYEIILNFSLNEEVAKYSIIAAKKKDFRNIDFFTIDFINQTHDTILSQGLNQQEIKEKLQEISTRCIKGTIRLQDHDTSQIKIKFSTDLTKVFVFNKNQSIIMTLSNEFDNPIQSQINHLDNKNILQISRYGNNDFIIATAMAQDKEISIRLASDQNKKFKFYIRFVEGLVQIRDIFTFDNKIRIVVTRDDEEFFVWEFENFQTQTMWCKHNETSNYEFEWPYICYLKGNHIIIQNAFNPLVAVFINMKNFLKPDYQVTHLSLTEHMTLYITICTPDNYIIFERDLDLILNTVVKSEEFKVKEDAKLKRQNELQRSLKQFQRDEIQQIPRVKETIGNVQIYRFFIRGTAKKEFIQVNNLLMIFFQCDYKLFLMNELGFVQKVDDCFKLKKIDENHYVYNTMRQQGKPSNIIKYLIVSYSDYQEKKVYEELDGKLIDFHIQESQLIVLMKPKDEVYHILKIFDINERYAAQLKFSHQIKQDDFIGTFITAENMFNNILPAGNNLYTIVEYNNKIKIHYYKDVLPCFQKTGEYINFISPLINKTYRKLAYFKSNKVGQKPKEATILPFLRDHYVLFNKRFNAVQLSNFSQQFEKTKIIKTYDQFISLSWQQKHLYKFSFSGQLLQRINLHNLFSEYGDKNLAISPNGSLFLQQFEDSLDFKQMNILKIGLKHEKIVPNNENKQMTAKEITKQFTVNLAKENLSGGPKFNIGLVEQIQNDQLTISLANYLEIKKFNLEDIINYLVKYECEVQYKVNDNQDIAIAFFNQKYKKKSEENQKLIKEMFLIKKVNKQRILFKVKIERKQLDQQHSPNGSQNKQEQLKVGLLMQYSDNAQDQEREFNTFIDIQEFRSIQDFSLSNDHLLIWSKDKIYYGKLDTFNSSTQLFSVNQSQFIIHEKEEGQIVSVCSRSQTDEDAIKFREFIIVKIIMEKKRSVIMRYRLGKEKEFCQFDCDIDAEPFFDLKNNPYILDKDVIIDMKQGVPLYFFKTGIKDVNKTTVMGKNLLQGSRFSKEGIHFMIKNKIQFPFNYFTFVLIQNNKGKSLDKELYDPEAFFCLDSQLMLHDFANNYNVIHFVLEQYEKTNPQLINLLLLKNKSGKNALDLAIEKQSTRSVNLILQKLSKLTVNNIHQVQQNFEKLIDYKGFQNYLQLCFFQTQQMKHKTSLQIENNEDGFIIDYHNTAYLDEKFYQKYSDSSQTLKPVKIKALDAQWIIQSKEGFQFLDKLSSSDNIEYFQIEAVVTIVRFLWSNFKWKIIKFLFLPFVIHLVIFNIYAVIIFENYRENPKDPYWHLVNSLVQATLILFTFYTGYVEAKQIQYHKNNYTESIWNLFDISTVVLTPAIVILDIIDVNDIYVRPLIAICLLFFYMRLFYFLRIFDKTSYLVRIILEITYDIKYFLCVLAIGIVGFGASFFVMSNNNFAAQETTPDGSFKIENFQQSILYSYKLILGEFNIDGFNDSQNPFLLWVLFIICSLFTMIVLLNMLIAIMGDSFNRVAENSENQSIREQLQLIVENDFLMNRNVYFKDVKYLISIRNDNEDADEKEQISQQLHDIKKSLMKKYSKMSNNIQELKISDEYQVKQFAHLKQELNSIKSMIKQQNAFRPNGELRNETFESIDSSLYILTQ